MGRSRDRFRSSSPRPQMPSCYLQHRTQATISSKMQPQTRSIVKKWLFCSRLPISGAWSREKKGLTRFGYFRFTLRNMRFEKMLQEHTQSGCYTSTHARLFTFHGARSLLYTSVNMSALLLASVRGILVNPQRPSFTCPSMKSTGKSRTFQTLVYKVRSVMFYQ